jgi:DNA mismatch repair protein MutH
MFGDLRTLVRDLNFAVLGVPVTIMRAFPVPDEEPLETTGIWLTPLTQDVGLGSEFQRREPQRILAISRDAVALVPRGSIIMAPERAGEADRRWRVDGTERVEADHARVVVIPDFELAP